MPDQIFHLESLTVSGFMGCHLVALNPKKPLTLIGGQNEQGKTSFLSALPALLEGKASLAESPVNNADGKAELAGLFRAKDGTLIKVIKVISKEGTHKLRVELENGPFQTPQAVAEKLFGKTLDPMAFARAKDKDRMEMLQGILGIDLSGHNITRKQIYDARTEINREADKIKGALSKKAHFPGGYEKEVSLVAPAEEVKEVKPELVSVSELNAKLDEARTANKAIEDGDKKCTDKINDLVEQDAVVAELKEKLEKAMAKSDQIKQSLHEAQSALDLLVPIDETPIRAAISTAEATNKAAQDEADRINREARANATERARVYTASAQATNEKVRANKERAALVADLTEVEKRSDAKTDELKALDSVKAELLAAHPLPVPGLVFDGDSITYKGLPFSEKQLSSAEIRTISCLLAFETAKQLKVVIIQDGSLLDEAHKALVGRLAEEHDFQVLMEVVGEEGADIIIEGGFVKGRG